MQRAGRTGADKNLNSGPRARQQPPRARQVCGVTDNTPHRAQRNDRKPESRGATVETVPDPVPIFRHARPLHAQMPARPPNTRPGRITSFSCTRRRVIGRAPRRAGLRGGNNRFSSDSSGATPVPSSASRHSPPRLKPVVFTINKPRNGTTVRARRAQ